MEDIEPPAPAPPSEPASNRQDFSVIDNNTSRKAIVEVGNGTHERTTGSFTVSGNFTGESAIFRIGNSEFPNNLPRGTSKTVITRDRYTHQSSATMEPHNPVQPGVLSRPTKAIKGLQTTTAEETTRSTHKYPPAS